MVIINQNYSKRVDIILAQSHHATEYSPKNLKEEKLILKFSSFFNAKKQILYCKIFSHASK